MSSNPIHKDAGGRAFTSSAGESETACPEAVETCAGYNLRRTARAVTQVFDAAFAPSGLRSTQAAVLQMIAAKESSSLAELAREMEMDPSTLSRKLRPLVRDGLVDTETAGRGKAKPARLTSHGRAKLAEIMVRWQQAQAEFVRRFGSRRWEQLRNELRSAADAVDARRQREAC